MLFRRIYDLLDRKGRLVIVDKFALERTSAPPSRLVSAFVSSMQSPSQSIEQITIEVVQTRLQQAGFGDISVTSVPVQDDLPWNIDWSLLEARKQTTVV